MRRATTAKNGSTRSDRISIHALLAESDWWLRCWQLAARDISIHALLAESDIRKCQIIPIIQNFYPRSPCGERRGARSNCFGRITFLSTLSLRRATHYLLQAVSRPCYFYPRSPCGERPCRVVFFLARCINFYPRSPCGERPPPGLLHSLGGVISIHALLAESDVVRVTVHTCRDAISIHALLAESDRLSFYAQYRHLAFLSTLSLRRATVHYDNYNLHCVISIHALLAESDLKRLKSCHV